MSEWKFTDMEYSRPDFEDAKTQLIAWKERVEKASSVQDVFDVMAETEEVSNHLFTQFTLVYIRHTLDTADEFYDKEQEYLNEKFPEIETFHVALMAAIADSPYRPDVEARYGKQFFSQIDLQRRSFCEANIPLMQRESKLTMEYEKIMASCQIEFDGKTLNLYGIQKYFEHHDRNVRQAAFKAWSNFFHTNEPRLEEIWEELISIRNEMGRNLGFENFIPLGYLQQGRTDYGQKEVAEFREQVRRVLVPLCEKLYEAQAKRLGIPCVKAWDEQMIFADGNADPIGDDDALVAEAQKMYHELSPETGEFIDFMIGHGLMDLKNRPGKASTGYMTGLPDLKAPFVFSCFNGTISDIQVLTHELGHAFAGYMAMRNQPISAYYYESTDIAEIHSMSMEQFCYSYAEQFFGDQADKFRFAHLQQAMTFVPFAVAVDEFQHICYTHPRLTPKERTLEWHKLERRYMPWRQYGDDEFMRRGGFWYHKIHIFLYPLYYINYTLTTMGAMEFKKKYAENREAAWEDYLKLCKVGGSMSYLETLRHANLSVPFEEGAVAKATSYAAVILLKALEDFEK